MVFNGLNTGSKADTNGAAAGNPVAFSNQCKIVMGDKMAHTDAKASNTVYKKRNILLTLSRHPYCFYFNTLCAIVAFLRY